MPFVVGLTIQPIIGLSNKILVEITGSLGLEHIEFDMRIFNEIETISNVLQAKQTAIHAPYINDYGFDLGSNDRIQDVNQFISHVNQVTETWNVCGVIVHPPIGPKKSFDLFIDAISQLEPTVLLENVFGDEGPGMWSEFLDYFLNIRDHIGRNIGFCFDIPHSYIANGVKEYLRIPKTLKTELFSPRGYIHLSQGCLTKDTHWPLTREEGEIPINTEVKSFLKGFSGTVNLELRPEQKTDIPSIIESYLFTVRMSSFWKYYNRLLLVMLKRRSLAKKLTERMT